MKYIFLCLVPLFAGSFAGIAQKKKPSSAIKPQHSITNAPPPVASDRQASDTNVVRVAQKQAVTGFDINQFVANNFKYPPAVLEDSNFVAVRIVVEFIVEKDASISGVKIVKMENKVQTNLQPNTVRLLKQEVMRVMRNMPPWQSPAYKNGEAVRIYFSLPLTLRAE